jgi:glycosyltransferase involved in cell wall biosynthesis
MGSSLFGGSEELWTRTAVLLAKQGIPVAASVHGWPRLDPRILGLSQSGVDLRPRPVKRSLAARARRHLSGKDQIVFDIEQSFGRTSPSLVVISDGVLIPPIELAEMCIRKGWPFAILTHSALPSWWASDEFAAVCRKVLPMARRCFFVAEASRILLEKQLGHEFDNAEIVRNPVVIQIESPLPWPVNGPDQELHMACVGRLSPEKGQDILLEALANLCWTERNWRLTFYGSGHTRDVLERLVGRLKLQNRTCFAGHGEVEKIWRENHILVMPSRFEGMPLTIVEAMFCGRPVVATNVGGIPELIKEDLTGFLAAPVIECFGGALERMWIRRDRLQEMGRLAAKSIREFMPTDPVGIFAEKLRSLARLLN